MNTNFSAGSNVNASTNEHSNVVIDCKLDKVFYGNFQAVRDSHIPIQKGKITGFIGPSGCGKSTVLRSLNRMNDLVQGFRFGCGSFWPKKTVSRSKSSVIKDLAKRPPSGM